ncbi:putative effector protein [Ceratobasidium theobromae]|uniref:Putative effector protein n=1 Tax=Ceratobasidium theobromae TaxID=1582974 RepID=A0A5N5QVA4_9AGAM|nr:putative effector protein [Ceratobasidium theobromae]
MFRLSFFTVLLAFFMALATFAAPVPAPTPDISVAEVVAPEIEARDESSILEKRRTGRATWFNTGLGACGKVSNDNQLIVALAPGAYAKGKNCGKTITIKNTKNGKSTTAKVLDMCPGCGANDVDLSPAAFKKLGSLSTGVLTVSWNI